MTINLTARRTICQRQCLFLKLRKISQTIFGKIQNASRVHVMCVTDGDVWNALFAIDSIFVCFDLVKVSRSHSAMIHGIVSEGSANAAYDFYYFTRYNCLVRQRTVHAHKLLLKTLPNHSFLQFTIKLFVRYGIHYRFPPIHIPRHTAMIHQPPFHREYSQCDRRTIELCIQSHFEEINRSER